MGDKPRAQNPQYEEPGITFYAKLVRDNQEAIIRANGHIPTMKTLFGQEFLTALKVKLVEEACELLNADLPGDELEELGDLLEVVHELSKFFGGHDKLIKQVREKKKRKGGFAGAQFLVLVERPAVNCLEIPAPDARQDVTSEEQKEWDYPASPQT